MSNKQQWEGYEQIARFLLNQFAAKFGLGRVEGKQRVVGRSGTTWEIDAKGICEGGADFLLIECRRYTNSRLNQGKVAQLAFTIIDTGAKGGIIVSPLELQAGAKRLAHATGIHHVRLTPESTTTDFVLKFLHNVHMGKSLHAIQPITATLGIKVIRADGTVEQ